MNRLEAHNGYYLTQKNCEDYERIFAKRITGVNATSEYWQECTNEAKEQWETEHPQPDNENS